MCEEESYKLDGEEDSLPREYVAKVVLYLNFERKYEMPDENDIEAIMARHGFRAKDFEIEEIDTV